MELSIFTILIIIVEFMRITSAAEAEKSVQQIKVGDKVHLLCQYNGSIERCSFVIPGEKYEVILEPNLKQENENYGYFGRGFDEGECGVTIENVSASNEGFATCILTVNSTFELNEAIEVRIIDRNDFEMSLPKMKILNNSPLKVGQTLAAECAAKSYKDVNFLWLLDDRILNATNVAMVKKKYERDKGIVFEYKSILKYDPLDMSDDGSVLRCRIKVGNESSDSIDTTLMLEVLNETNISEPLAGEPYDISINFFAFPRVLSSRWKVNKRTIYYGKASNEFSSRELKYLGNNQWNAILHIANITNENIHYNYTLQVSDSEGTKFYHQRLDTLSSTTKSTYFNTTSLPKYQKEKQHMSSGSSFRRTTTMRNFSNTNESIAQPTTTAAAERKIKFVRKQQQPSQNTSTTITEMTSVIGSTYTTTTTIIPITSTTQASSTSISLLADNANETKNSVKITEFETDINDHAKNTYFDITIYENTTTESDSSGSISDGAKHQNIFVASIFVFLILIIIIIASLLCHYQHQVSILKTEIIQMNLESYYNQSCFLPSNFNNYSASTQRSALALICDNKQSFSESSDESMNIVQTYNTNSHLYQSIDEIIDTHVYDEIISSKEPNSESQRVDEKLNNYDTNESFNNINEILIPQHCQTLMTIEEVDEYESSQSQKLSNMESTYI